MLRNEVEWKTSRIVSDETEIKWNKIKYYWIIQIVKDLETEIEGEIVRENQEIIEEQIRRCMTMEIISIFKYN